MELLPIFGYCRCLLAKLIFVRISTTSRIDGCSFDSEAIRSWRRCEVGSVVGSKAEAKHADWMPTERSRKTHEPPYDLALDFLAACIVDCWSVTTSAIHPILHTQHLFLVILHSAGV
jgi:hypothetical protein